MGKKWANLPPYLPKSSEDVSPQLSIISFHNVDPQGREEGENATGIPRQD